LAPIGCLIVRTGGERGVGVKRRLKGHPEKAIQEKAETGSLRRSGKKKEPAEFRLTA